MIVKFWKMLNAIRLRDTLPKLPNGYYAPFDVKKLDDNERFVLSAARALDPAAAKDYLNMKDVENAYEVSELFQPKPIPARRRRFINWLRRLLNESTYDLAISDYYRQEREKEKGIFRGELRIGNRKR